MKRTRFVLVGVLGAFAAGGLAASSASAFPLFAGQTPNSGSKGLTIKTTTFETVGGHKIACPSYEDNYQIISTEVMRLNVSLYTCTAKGAPCNNSSVGVIILSLQGSLGYLNRAKREVGVRFRNANGSSEFVRVFCGGLGESIYGGVIGKISPVDKVVIPPAHFTLALKQANGMQALTAFEGGGTETLSTVFDGGAEEATGLSFGAALSFEHEEAVVG